MPERFPFTRRQFLHTGLVAMSTAASIPTFLQHSAQAMANDSGGALASRPGVPEDRILVVVQLSGGNDGLNTVIPFGQREYYDNRPRINIADTDVIKLDKHAGIGLHPSLAALRQMMDNGTASVIQGVGYPNPNRSHFASMDIWHTGDTLGGRGLGWVGKAMDQVRATQGEIDSVACVCIGAQAPLAAQGHHVKPISFEHAELFRWSGSDLHPALSEPYDGLNRNIESAAADDPQAAFVLRTAMDAQVASDRIRAAARQQPLTSFPAGRLANQLRMVAAMIRAGLPTRVYYVALGGFDTHANQVFSHGNLLREFAVAMRAFYAELAAMRQQDRVLSLAFSEFGRRVNQNASNGTDHGAAGPVFMFGDMIQPGLLGTHPSFDTLDRGDLAYNLDFRCIYAAVLDQWMKIDSRRVLGQAFKPADVIQRRVRT
jgi:uncharacterized protein (DUF1501 family)